MFPIMIAIHIDTLMKSHFLTQTGIKTLKDLLGFERIPESRRKPVLRVAC